MKTCPRCKTSKELTEFYFHVKTGYYLSYCKPCSKESALASQKKKHLPPGYHAALKRARRDGTALPDKTSYRNAPPKPSMCELCAKEKPKCMDHDHNTGKFRGWLCNRCNTVLGFVETYSGVWEYLKRGK